MPDLKRIKKQLEESDKADQKRVETAKALEEAAQQGAKLKTAAEQLKKELGGESDE
jgi:hypothetical protein